MKYQFCGISTMDGEKYQMTELMDEITYIEYGGK